MVFFSVFIFFLFFFFFFSFFLSSFFFFCEFLSFPGNNGQRTFPKLSSAVQQREYTVDIHFPFPSVRETPLMDPSKEASRLISLISTTCRVTSFFSPPLGVPLNVFVWSLFVLLQQGKKKMSWLTRRRFQEETITCDRPPQRPAPASSG